MTLTQQNRQIKLSTPLGEDKLLLVGFSGQEEMSRLFRFQLELISEDNAIKAADIVGKNVTFSIDLADGSHRYFNGFVCRFAAGDEEEGCRNYRAEVVPWLWFLTQTANCRLFQNKKIPDIIQQVFSDRGFSDFELNIKLDHKKWEYCVQYRESDFNFVTRLMEQEGIFYFFKHEDDKHQLVLADHKGAYTDCTESEVDYPPIIGQRMFKDHLTSWEQQFDFCSGKWAQTDYNFETPSTSLLTNSNSVVPLPGIDKYEVFDYPGVYRQKSEGDVETKVRMEEIEVAHNIVHSSSGCRSFFPGGKFKVGMHRSSSEEGKTYVLTMVRHEAREPLAYATGPDVGGPDYNNVLRCIPDAVVFRPARSTSKPVVHGVQTAVVVGPSGEEIYTDKYGRVKVQFHWDREGKKDENSSCWIRVSQNWAGKNWGIVFNPRIGQEVIVDFLEGDPDQPIIVGRVYNAEQMPPYELPANQTQSTIKSRSSKGGGVDNFNEIRFEDRKGSEQLFIHAEKNQVIEVENDETHWVGHDRTKRVDHDEMTTISHDRTERVEHDETIQIDNDRKEEVGGNENIRIGKNRSERVEQDEEIVIAGNRLKKVDKDEKQQIGQSRTISIGKDDGVDISGGRSISVGKNDSLSVGKQLVIDAGDSITLKTGDAMIVMKKNGDILIKGKNLSLEGTGTVNVKASGDVKIKGSKIAQN